MTDNDELLAAIKAAQAAPAADYMLWAVVPGGHGENAEVPLEAVRLPLTMEPDYWAVRLRSQARLKLKDLGFDQTETEAAQVHLGAIPDVIPTLDRAVVEMKRGGPDLVLFDFVGWEAVRRQTGLKPLPIGGDEEIVYQGLHIRRSAAR